MRAGKPCSTRQRRAVHADGEQRVASVHHDLGRRADRHAVVGGHAAAGRCRGGCRPRAAGRPAGRPSHRALLIRSPPTSFETQHSVIQRSIIGRASSCVVGERHRPVDHAVDAQLPVLRVDLRHAERGVDAVEVAVRRRPRHAALAEVDAARQRRRRRRGSGSATLRRAAVDVEARVLQRPSAEAG